MYSYWFVNDDVHRLATKAIRNSAYLRNNKKQDDLVPSKSRAIVSENADIDKKFWLVIRQSESENGQVELSIDSVLNSYDDALSYASGLSDLNAGTKYFVSEASDVFFTPKKQSNRKKL